MNSTKLPRHRRQEAKCVARLFLAAILLPATTRADDTRQPGGNDAYAIEVSPTRKITARLTCQVKAPRLKADEWVVYAALPPTLDGQTEIRAEMTPQAVTTKDLGPRGQPLLLARFKVRDKAQRKSLDVEVVYEAQLAARRLVLRDERDAALADEVEPAELEGTERAPLGLLDATGLDPAERAASLESNARFDFETPSFQEWLDREGFRRGKDEGEIDFARHVFAAMKDEMEYEYPTTAKRIASKLCERLRSDCGGINLLLVSVLRAEGVPARLLVGHWAKSALKGELLGDAEYYQWHVKGEFFAEAVGWVPMDLASAVLHDPEGNGLDYFGQDEGDFLTQHIDLDMTVDTFHFGRQKLLVMQDVLYWARGSGSFDDHTMRQDWQVESAWTVGRGP